MTMKKFNKTLSFNYGDSNVSHCQMSDGLQNVTSLTKTTSSSERKQYSSQGRKMVGSPDNDVLRDSVNGLSGIFIPIKNDFSVLTVDLASNGHSIKQDFQHSPDCDRYRNAAHKSSEENQRVKKVRFIICLLALSGLALGLMSRLMLNVSIVEMVKKSGNADSNKAGDNLKSESSVVSQDNMNIEKSAILEDTTIDELLVASEDGLGRPVVGEQAPPMPEGVKNQTLNESVPNRPNPGDENEHDDDDNLRFDWSKKDVNIVLGAFYIGYGPGILFSGSLAEKYGAKYPLLICVFGSAIINILTPLIASYSLNLLIASRVSLGIIQGSLLPCLYELFNRWLTQTESSIFAPMIKVSMPLGSLIGTIMPGILATLELPWPNLFYIGGFLCLAWSIAWISLATSFPQNNRFVELNELDRIMRKKKSHLNKPATVTEKAPCASISTHVKTVNCKSKNQPGGTPWLLIVTSPSVLALTAVKFTYNIGMDFIFLQVAMYLREVHNAPIETISAIASSGYCMQMLLISFVGWLAKVVIIKRACGLSVTKWRKIFQGSSNFMMALFYVALAYLEPNLEVATVLLMMVCFWWMMGAGGESMIPYDLSSEYPASIVGFAHSISIFSGVAVTALCDAILGENTKDPQRWSSLFYLLAALLAGGGMVFVLFIKAKPFLPGEKVPRATRRALKQRSQQRRTTTIRNQNDQINHTINVPTLR